MNVSVRARLAALMALIYAVQGAFWPLLAVHLTDLGITSRERGWIFATLAIGSSAVPLVVGHLVDRIMAIQRYLALIYVLGAGLLVVLALGLTSHAVPLFVLFLAYWLLVAPSGGLSNTLALRNLKHPLEDFGWVRMWGTVGWMVAGWAVSLVMVATGSTRGGHGAYEAFWAAAGLAAIVAVYCLTLPHTPPLAIGQQHRSSGWREGIELVRQPGMAVVLLTSFGVYLTVPFVFQVMPTYLESRGLPRAWVAMALTVTQIPEITGLALMPWLLRRVSYRGLLSLGIAAWLVRFVSLVVSPSLVVAIAGMALYGLGVAYFTVGSQLFIDTKAPAHRRASVQSLHLVLTSGLGMLLGSLLAGEVMNRFPTDYAAIFLVPACINGLLLAVFFVAFRPEITVAAEVLPSARPARPPAVRRASDGRPAKAGGSRIRDGRPRTPIPTPVGGET
jgi:MFS family permease